MGVLVDLSTINLEYAILDANLIRMPRDPELMAKLAQIGAKRPEEVSLQELLEMCVLLERHENDQHLEYAQIAREERYPEIAEIFKDLAEGERFYHSNLIGAMKREVKA